jgi:enterochelin esterase-like enzyme
MIITRGPTFEAGFRQATRQWAGRLQRAGLPCRYQEWVGGHDSYWWQRQLPAALAWVLAPPRESASDAAHLMA